MTALRGETTGQGNFNGIPLVTDFETSSETDTEGDITTAILCFQPSRELREILPKTTRSRKIESVTEDNLIDSARVQIKRGRKVLFIIDVRKSCTEGHVDLAKRLRDSFPSEKKIIVGESLAEASKPKYFHQCCNALAETYETLPDKLNFFLR